MLCFLLIAILCMPVLQFVLQFVLLFAFEFCTKQFHVLKPIAAVHAT